VIREYVGVIAEVATTLEPGTEDITEREEKFEALIDRFEATEDPIRQGMAAVMLGFLAGLFVGEQEYELAFCKAEGNGVKIGNIGPFLPRIALAQLGCGAPDHASDRRVPQAGPGCLGSLR
jgi:hypothetical protein